MKRLSEIFKKNFKALLHAFSRFPLTGFFFAMATGLVWYMIHLSTQPSLFVEKLCFTVALGAVISAAAQAAYERLKGNRLFYYLGSLLLIVMYYFILSPSEKINAEITVRTLVAVFSFLCAFLWIPSYKRAIDFNPVILTHFKSFFTAILYSAVLSIGISAIIAAVDILLVKVDNDLYAYANSAVWIFFMPMYYLSVLPKFNSQEEEDLLHIEKASAYPKFLDILFSRIAIPLLLVFTAVLTLYFAKILISMKWPIGQLGPIALGYSIAGISVYILSSLLDNSFVRIYQKWFPKFLIGIVLLQLVSVGIRVNAYGITESRYYVALFGLYSIVSGAILTVKPKGLNGLLVLLVAGFAIFSVLPPVDTFTVSRLSQVHRIEKILISENMLSAGKLIPSATIKENNKEEVTNILNYLYSRDYGTRVKWLPKTFNPYNDMKVVFGFDPYYKGNSDPTYSDTFMNLDASLPMDIAGYDSVVMLNSSPQASNNTSSTDIRIKEISYKIQVKELSTFDSIVTILDSSGNVLVSTNLYEEAKKINGASSDKKNMLPPSAMSFEKTENGNSMKIIFQSIHLNDERADYSFYVLVKGSLK